ncbi:squalene/phytoene synthase family protein [Cereibacter sediminicola]|uniref:squalene/phytoene synthase family protein n=1 Tax=Cereibacter sediminicola TaxID=2584941 RepID=UPI0011AB01D4|nr:squalene/phytoene synthase family protein [Cereibacter sediminicola]
MTLEACAGLVERGDPDRHAAAMAAPPAARSRLLPLYAFNLEVARAPWVTREPMIAEMRLQFWRDVIEEAAQGRVRAHEVAAPLAEVIREAGLPVPLLDAMVEARRRDIWAEPFEDEAAFAAHIEATAAGLMWASALALGAPGHAEGAVRGIGWAAGLAAWLQAVPELEARGRQPLPDGRPEAVARLARRGLARLAEGRRGRLPAVARPALLPAWQTGALLRLAAAEPGRVASGTLQLSEFSRRWRLLRSAFTGRV